MYHCGIAVEMNYGPSSSGSNLDGYQGARNGLVNYFKYDEDALYAEKIDFEDTVWRSMILDNLEQGYPIIYGGWNPSTWTGHAWNLDGFEKVGDLYHYHMNWGWGGMVFQGLFWLVIVIAVVWAIKYFAGQRQIGTTPRGDSALDILKQRYAKGEIDKQEFEQKKKDLIA